MKKIITILTIIVLTAVISLAQDDCQKRMMIKPHCESLVSDNGSKKKEMSQRPSWEKRKKENEKKWKKHLAWECQSHNDFITSKIS